MFRIGLNPDKLLSNGTDQMKLWN